jgi:hypothetical protein
VCGNRRCVKRDGNTQSCDTKFSCTTRCGASTRRSGCALPRALPRAAGCALGALPASTVRPHQVCHGVQGNLRRHHDKAADAERGGGRDSSSVRLGAGSAAAAVLALLSGWGGGRAGGLRAPGRAALRQRRSATADEATALYNVDSDRARLQTPRKQMACKARARAVYAESAEGKRLGLYTCAAAAGALDTLRWLALCASSLTLHGWRRDCGAPWASEMCAAAAGGGHLAVLRWLQLGERLQLGAVAASDRLPLGRGDVPCRGGRWPPGGAAVAASEWV